MTETLPIRAVGSFWVPDNPSRKVPGILEISTSGDIKLELNPYFSGSFNEFRRQEAEGFGLREPDWVLILGELDKLGRVSLYACHDRRPEFMRPIPPKDVQAKFALIGALFKNANQMQFKELRFAIQGLESWVGDYGIKVDNVIGSANAQIRFELPNEKEFPLTDGRTFKFFSGYNLRPSLGRTDFAEVKQIDYISLSIDEPLGITDALEVMDHIRNFFSLAVGQKIPIRQMVAIPARHLDQPMDGHDDATPVSIYYQGMDEIDPNFEVDRFRLLFNYGILADSFAEIINTWLTACMQYRTVTNIYFSAVESEARNLDVRFLILMQGLESLHRIENRPRLQIDKENLGGIRYFLSKFLDRSSVSKSLDSRLRDRDTTTLLRRLKDLIAPFRSHFGRKTLRDGFVWDAKTLRDRLTHEGGQAIDADNEIEH